MRRNNLYPFILYTLGSFSSCHRACCAVVIGIVLISSVPSITTADGPVVRKSGGVEAGIDRLTWLSGLESRLEKSKRPSCIGPLGCKAEIPVDSPCRKPAKQNPEVVIDGVVPGGAPDTWVVAYRLTCSPCYEGATGYLLLVSVDKRGHISILDKTVLKKGNQDEIAAPLEMVSDDFDEDGSNEIACRYRTIREKAKKCTGMTDASGFLLISRPGKKDLGVLFHEQLDRFVNDKGDGYRTEYRFEDVSEDGYPDLVMIRTPLVDPTARNAVRAAQSVRLYNETLGRWSDKSYEGVIVGSGRFTGCDVPVPGRNYAVVAALHREKQLNDNIAALSDALRQAGYQTPCVYDADAFGGIGAVKYVTIVSAHASRNDADAEKIKLRNAGFSPFVKTLFDE